MPKNEKLKAEDECIPGGVYWLDVAVKAYCMVNNPKLIPKMNASLWRAIKGKSLFYRNYTAMYLCQHKMAKAEETTAFHCNQIFVPNWSELKQLF